MSTPPHPRPVQPAQPAQPAQPDSAASAGCGDRVGAVDPSGPDLWATVGALTEWLDGSQPVGGREGLLLRVLKLSEEVGEVAQAVVGATGQNPRKGVSHTWEDVQSELCDVVITALVALRTLTPEAAAVFAARLTHVAERSLGGAGDRPAQSAPRE
ncbi:MazG-like family protein [Streptomyces asoensis]|uniref:MazG-like family protein n=1 Tax=Streptomyces asoensis TaxID=249586 RepID=UPI003D9E6CC9